MINATNMNGIIPGLYKGVILLDKDVPKLFFHPISQDLRME
jgi:hypothetical protein